MHRGLKQFVYGLFYLLIIALVVWGIISSSGEETVVKEEPGYLSVDVVEETKFFQLSSGETSFLVKFANPNKDTALSFSYRFVALGKEDNKVGEIRGGETIFPGAEEFVVGYGDFEKSINEAKVKIFDETEVSTSNSLEEEVGVKEVKTEVGKAKAKITGVLENKSLLSLPEVKIISVLADKFGFRLFAGSTVLEEVESFGEENFEIFVPVDDKLKEKVDATSTQVYVNLE